MIINDLNDMKYSFENEEYVSIWRLPKDNENGLIREIFTSFDDMIKANIEKDNFIPNRFDGPAIIYYEKLGQEVWEAYCVKDRIFPLWVPKIKNGELISGSITKEIIAKVIFEFDIDYGLWLNKLLL